VAIARALAAEPEVLIADEPTSSLDVSVQAQILALFDRLAREHHLTLIFATHDFGVVRTIARRVAVMHLGEIVEDGPVDQLIHDPRHPYTQALLSAVPSASRPRARIILRGRPQSAVEPPSGCRFHPRCLYATDRCAAEVPPMLQLGPDRRVACHYPEVVPASERPGPAT
jgi:oligopeptide/dipeptide ABC transporter ATP-binding protein